MTTSTPRDFNFCAASEVVFRVTARTAKVLSARRASTTEEPGDHSITSSVGILLGEETHNTLEASSAEDGDDASHVGY